MLQSSTAPEIATGLCLFLDREGALFYEQSNTSDVKKHPNDWTPRDDSSGSKSEAIVANISDPVTTAPSIFS